MNDKKPHPGKTENRTNSLFSTKDALKSGFVSIPNRSSYNNGAVAFRQPQALFSYLYKPKHFVRSFVRVMLLITRHLVVRLEILAPKLEKMKTAFVNVKMNIALLKVRSASFPNLSFGVKLLNR